MNPTRNDDFRPRSRIWDRSGIHLKRVQTLTVIRRYRDSLLRGLSYTPTRLLCVFHEPLLQFRRSSQHTMNFYILKTVLSHLHNCAEIYVKIMYKILLFLAHIYHSYVTSGNRADSQREKRFIAFTNVLMICVGFWP